MTDDRTIVRLDRLVNMWLEALDRYDLVIDDTVVATLAFAQVHRERRWCLLNYLSGIFSRANY